jgi:hypothetical protein
VTADFALQAPLLLAPLVGEAVVEVTVDIAVELVAVHGMYAVTAPIG